MAIVIKHTNNGLIRVIRYKQKPKKVDALSSAVPIQKDTERNYKNEALARAKRTVIDYADNNTFNYFFTLTFDQSKVDRDNASRLYEMVKRSMRYYKEQYCCDLKFVLVPELHSDGQHIHFHGLLFLNEYAEATDLTQHWDKRKHCYFWRSEYFFKKYGACRFDKIFSNSVACSRYISKYITKQTEMLFPSTYLCSRGLAKSKTLFLDEAEQLLPVLDCYANDEIVKQFARPPFQNEYVQSFELDDTLFQFFGQYLLQFGWHYDKILLETNGLGLCFTYSIVSPDGECYI